MGKVEGKKMPIVNVWDRALSACDGVAVDPKAGSLEEKRDVKDQAHLHKPASNKLKINWKTKHTASLPNLFVIYYHNDPIHLPIAYYNSQLKCLPSVSVDVRTLQFYNVMGHCSCLFRTWAFMHAVKRNTLILGRFEASAGWDRRNAQKGISCYEFLKRPE